MRYFVDNFEKVYNKENPFGFFPAWNYYPKTGTHVGTDFRVVIGTPIFAPVDGELFKASVSGAKGNVGIYIFDYKGVTWGLELCHLRELPKLGIYKEGEVIAYSGNTGSATTGAHLHAVLHRDAQVTAHYELLQSRAAFLQLEKDGAIVDCLRWFCDNIKKEAVDVVDVVEVVDTPTPTPDSTPTPNPTPTPDPTPVQPTPAPQKDNKSTKNLFSKVIDFVKALISRLRGKA